MRVALDTNVIVSGFLNPYGAPGSLLHHTISGRLTACYDARIISEYREVLLRPRLSLEISAVDSFLDFIEAEGFLSVAQPLLEQLPDRSDEAFLEVALGSQSSHLITGNLKHFPASRCQGVKINSPAQFLKEFI